MGLAGPGRRPPSSQILSSGTRGEDSSKLAVVHLVWGPLGAEPLRRFVTSYRAHQAGIEHELVILLNGVTSQQRSELLTHLADLKHRLLDLPKPVQDLTAYAQAAERLTHERLCFLNSYSEILAPNWLGHLNGALAAPGTGLAGASGSWASLLSYGLLHAGLPSAYRRIYSDRRETLAQFAELDAQRTGISRSLGAPRRWAHTALALAGNLAGFERFPAHHLRTNAFMIERAVMTKMVHPTLRRKVHAYRLESGRASLTRQVEHLGGQAVVVDRNGHAYQQQDWPHSETFWQGEQRGLLVADNQTEDYRRADPARRLLLSRYAWGKQAQPC